jgi:predicted secreted hydrolase
MSRFLLLFLLLSVVPFQSGAFAEYRQVLPGKVLNFPKVLAAHPEYPLEWWYFTGHLQEAAGRMFGFELTFFRVGTEASAPLASQNLMIGHFAITDDKEKRFVYAETMAREDGSFAMASSDTLQVKIGSWLAVLSDGKINLQASAKDKRQNLDFSLNLSLEAAKPAVLHGEGGYSRKGPGEGDASYYVSFTRLLGTGNLEIGNEAFEVKAASAWMDHEIISFEPQSPEVGWQWFAIQLENNTELMLYYIYRGEPIPSSFSKGSFINEKGEVFPLALDDYSIEVTDHWQSPLTGTRYPSGWRITLPTLKKKLFVTPTVPHQEIVSDKTTGMTYWEGRSVVEGTKGEGKIEGSAYVEIVGAERFAY